MERMELPVTDTENLGRGSAGFREVGKGVTGRFGFGHSKSEIPVLNRHSGDRWRYGF